MPTTFMAHVTVTLYGEKYRTLLDRLKAKGCSIDKISMSTALEGRSIVTVEAKCDDDKINEILEIFGDKTDRNR